MQRAQLLDVLLDSLLDDFRRRRSESCIAGSLHESVSNIVYCAVIRHSGGV